MKSLRHGSPLVVLGIFTGIILTASLNRCAAEEGQAAQVQGSDVRVSLIRRGSKLLLNASDAATAFGWEAKIVADGRMLTLCRNGDNGLCVPVRLSNVVSIRTDEALFVDAAALTRPLRFRVMDFGGIVTLAPNSHEQADDPDVPAYNAAWGEGRGFRVGQTLPDIPLIDLDGREVRFSRFLGKPYIIYCWASW